MVRTKDTQIIGGSRVTLTARKSKAPKKTIQATIQPLNKRRYRPGIYIYSRLLVNYSYT